MMIKMIGLEVVVKLTKKEIVQDQEHVMLMEMQIEMEIEQDVV